MTGSVTAGGEAVEPIRCEVTDRIAVVTIDRTARRNALNLDALHRLDDAVASAVADGAAAVVFRGEGGHFCAGADLKELEDQSFDTRLRGVLERIATLPVPTFAAISGACMGLGMQLALACDIRVATDDAYFGIPAGKLRELIGKKENHWYSWKANAFWPTGVPAFTRKRVPARNVVTLKATVRPRSANPAFSLAERCGELSRSRLR